MCCSGFPWFVVVVTGDLLRVDSGPPTSSSNSTCPFVLVGRDNDSVESDRLFDTLVLKVNRDLPGRRTRRRFWGLGSSR